MNAHWWLFIEKLVSLTGEGEPSTKQKVKEKVFRTISGFTFLIEVLFFAA